MCYIMCCINQYKQVLFSFYCAIEFVETKVINEIKCWNNLSECREIRRAKTLVWTFSNGELKTEASGKPTNNKLN
jgi:hypothetical protein